MPRKRGELRPGNAGGKGPASLPPPGSSTGCQELEDERRVVAADGDHVAVVQPASTSLTLAAQCFALHQRAACTALIFDEETVAFLVDEVAGG